MKARSTFSLKDQLFNEEKVQWLAGQFESATPGFEKTTFCEEVLTEFPNLELKERIVHITDVLADHLPQQFETAVKLILKALPSPLDPKKWDDDFGDFIIAPLSHFVATRGCTREHLKISLNALRKITTRFSAEDAIRYFINAYPDKTMDFLKQCAGDKNYHVRRLASEGTRPKLPWCQKIAIHHQQPLPILDTLFSDPTRYVTRSVANHLNDISKLDPALVVETLGRWKESGLQSEKEMSFIVRHSTRTLIKQGFPGALSLLGFGEKPEILVKDFQIETPIVKVGEAVEFSFSILPGKSQNLLIDYRMLFAGRGKPGGQKVFKLKQIETTKNRETKLKKRHPMKLMTTRTLYEGEHSIILLVNGVELESRSFELVE